MKYVVVIAIVALVLILIGAALFFFGPKRDLVIGGEMADAEAREEEHRRKFAHLKSPLPAATYDDATLVDPRLSSLDQELRAISLRYAQSSATDRETFRNAATTDDFYKLLHFARRAAVFALREGNAEWIRAGLAASATIDASRIDSRDIPLNISLLHHAAVRLKQDPVALFDAAAALAEPQTADAIRSFPRSPADVKDVAASWGYREIATGFARSESHEYKPTTDLLAAALAVRKALMEDVYEADVTLASDFPTVWFPTAAEARAKELLEKSPAIVSLHADHRREQGQFILVFIVEMPSDAGAAALEQLALSGKPYRPGTLVLRDQRLFLLAVGNAMMHGQAPVETAQSMQRFREAFRGALAMAGSR